MISSVLIPSTSTLSRGVAQPPDEALAPGLRPLAPDNLQDPADLHHLDLIAFTQAELGAKMGRYGHLPLAFSTIAASNGYRVLQVLRNTRRPGR